MTALPGALVLLGHPVAHSLSPRFQNAALRAAGIPLLYESRDVPPDTLDATLDALARVRGAGNVTVPHKAAVFRRCAVRSAAAERAEAVNVFWHDPLGRLCGDNTDVGAVTAIVADLLDAVRPRWRYEDQAIEVALFGAGGAAAGVLVALESIVPQARVHVVNRDRARATRLANRFGSVVRVSSVGAALARATLVVNATSLGMRDDEMPCAPADIPRGSAVFDLVYRRDRLRDGDVTTAWAQECAARGLEVVDGVPMLLRQGALAFTRWFGVMPDEDLMRRALREPVA